MDLGKAKNMKSLLYGTSGINRLKLLRFMRLYGFLQLGDRRLGGSFCRLYGFIRFILCFTVWDRRPGEASADDTALYGVLFQRFFMVLRLRGWDLNLGRPKNGEKPYKRYTPSTISTSVYGLARRARKDRRARPCNFLALLALLA